MSGLLVLRKKMQEFYANKSIFVDKALQFVLGIVTLILINKNIGVYKAVMSPFITISLAVVCTFFPPIVIVLVTGALILLHLFKVSLGVMALAGMTFVLMYVFYCRFTPKKAIILLLTPLAFWLNIPYVVPVVCGLISTPVSVVPVAFGTIVYYMLTYVKESLSTILSVEGIVPQATLFAKAVFMNKELWIMVLAFMICSFTVYVIRRQGIDHAWKVAVAAGVFVNIIVCIAGNVVFDLDISYVALIVGNVAAIIVGIVSEFFFFSVDYTRTEHIQYEDDDYYYYVKAVPKVAVEVSEKTVKRINERRDDEEESEVICRKPQKKNDARKRVKRKRAEE